MTTGNSSALDLRRAPFHSAGWLVLVLTVVLLSSGCGTPKPPKKLPQHEWVTRHPKSDRLKAPPAGQALVNFHRPGFIYPQFTYAVFGGDGRFLADVPMMAEAQCLFAPGEQVFIGWILNNPVSVIQASLQADKVYDIWIVEGMNDRPRMEALTKDDARRAKLPEWEAAEDPVSLQRLPRVELSERKVQPKIEQIKKDFLGGPKSARTLRLREQDCR